MYFNFCIKVPLFLARFVLWIYCQNEKMRYGRAVRFIPLNNGRFVMVDAADYENLIKHKWHITIFHEYAMRREKGKTIYMHNEIMEPVSGFVVDHKDHNSLNNMRGNLRIATRSQNSCNIKKSQGCSSKYKGVSFNKALGKWVVSIRFQRKHIHLGYFDNEEDAARAYDAAARKHHGEFAV